MKMKRVTKRGATEGPGFVFVFWRVSKDALIGGGALFLCFRPP